MSCRRIALANCRFPATGEESIDIVCDSIAEASKVGAEIVCFPETIVPGYEVDATKEPVSEEWLEAAWAIIDAEAKRFKIWIILGTERRTDAGLHITARVTGSDGQLVGYQDKVQLDPSEDARYRAGASRRVFHMGDLTFGIVICHEGWRYPETVRWAARQGAHIVFHPHVELPDQSHSLPKRFADPDNTFHEKAALCRAAENTIYFATVNCALPNGTSTTSAVIDPDGNLIAHQPYGKEGLLICDIDIKNATRLFANRLHMNPGNSRPCE